MSGENPDGGTAQSRKGRGPAKPAETQSAKVFRLRGKGIRNVRSHAPGDLMVHVIVETPVKLTDRQKELLREFGDIASSNAERHNPKAKSWMDKVKDFFSS